MQKLHSCSGVRAYAWLEVPRPKSLFVALAGRWRSPYEIVHLAAGRPLSFILAYATASKHSLHDDECVCVHNVAGLWTEIQLPARQMPASHPPVR